MLFVFLYGFFAFFNNLDAAPETGGRSGADFTRGLQAPYISFPTERQAANLASLEAQVSAASAQVKILKKEVGNAADADQKKTLAKNLEQTQKELKKLRGKQAEIRVNVRAAMVMKERAEVRPAQVLIRGDYENPGDRVERATPSFLPPMKEL